NCPWCELLRAGGPQFFITVTSDKMLGVGTFVLATVWRQIEQVSAPRSHYQRPPLPQGARVVPSELPAHITARLAPFVHTFFTATVRLPWTFLQKTVGLVAIGAGLLFLPAIGAGAIPLLVFAAFALVIFASWWAVLELIRYTSQKRENAGWEEVWQRVQRERADRQQEVDCWTRAVEQEKERRQQLLQLANEAITRAEAHWQQEASKYAKSFSDLKASLGELKKRHDSLGQEYAREYTKLQQNARNAQLSQFLRKHFISDYSIPDIGAGRKAILLSFNIETALDVVWGRVDAVPGFGTKLTRKLLTWRAEIERTFQFDQTVGVPRSEIESLKSKSDSKKLELETQLAK